MPPPPSYRKRRRALEFLEAHGFKIELLVELVRVGLATASTERILTRGKGHCRLMVRYIFRYGLYHKIAEI